MRLAKLVPAPIRTKIKGAMRDMALESSLMPLRATGGMTEAQIAVFIEAWGDDGFSADTTYIGQIIQLMTSGPILECGTGASTLVENELGIRRGLKIYSLEQSASFAQEMARRDLKAVDVIHAPLKPMGDYQWYDVRAALPMHFSLVICDGPYIDKGLGEPTYSGWRYGVMPLLKSTGRTFDLMLLDDVVNHDRASAVLSRWKREFGVKVERVAKGGGRWAIVKP
jgi:hypothetical protein